MNIKKLAKHLKEFTLDEIEMIAECDCKTELEHLLNGGKIAFEQGLYRYTNNISTLKFGIFIDSKSCTEELTIEEAIEYFFNNYVTKYCSQKTNKIYKAAFKLDIVPILKKNEITEFNQKEIITIYNALLKRDFKPR